MILYKSSFYKEATVTENIHKMTYHRYRFGFLLNTVYFSVLHEKIFIIFMAASLLHMYCRSKVGCVGADEVEPVRSNKFIWALFFVSITATVGLIVFFLRHRLLCRPLGEKIQILFIYLFYSIGTIGIL